ncbi:MAG: transcription repressor NadR [Velocimicrobium sp.]
MDGDNRRNQLLTLLKNEQTPISGEKLSTLLGVSRQVIVQDIALLRASDHMILSTNRGYLMYPATEKIHSKLFRVSHTNDEIKDELYSIVDCGGYVKNVCVEHEVYGMIQADLNIRSRRDVDRFILKVNESKAIPLKTLGEDIHLHTIEAESDAILDEIERNLKEKGYLL